MASYPFLFILAAFVAGILLEMAGAWPGMAVVFVLLAAFLHSYLILKSRRSALHAAKASGEHGWWVILLFAGLGMADAWLAAPPQYDFDQLIMSPLARGEVTEILPLAETDRLTVRIDSFAGGGTEPVRVDLKAVVYATVPDLRIGDRVEFPNDLEPIPEALASRYRVKGITCRQYCDETETPRKTGASGSLHSRIAALRYKAERAVYNSGVSPSAADLISGILLGDRDAIDPEVKEDFSKAGVAHVLALSGLHIGILASICFWALMPVGLIAGRRSKIAVSIAVLWLFVIFTGMSVTAVRACIMASFCLLALLLERKNAAFNALCAAAMLILFVNPELIADAGLQFSFATVAAILLLSEIQRRDMSRREHPHLYFWIKTTGVTFVATFASLGITAYYFHRIPLLFPFANMVIVPLLPAYMIAAIAHLALYSVGIPLSFSAGLLDGATEFIFHHVAAAVASVDIASVTLWISGITAILFTAAVLLFAVAANRRRKLPAIAASVLAVLCAVSLFVTGTDCPPDGARLISRSGNNTLQITASGEERNVPLPSSKVWHCRYGATTIEAVNNNEISRTERKRDRNKQMTPPLPHSKKSCDLLLIGKNYRGSVEHLLRYYKPKRIGILSDVWRYQEEDLIAECGAFGIPCHVLRSEGPIEL